MAKVTFEFPAESLSQVVNDYCEMFGYRETVEDEEGNSIPNPQGKTDFATSRIIQDAKKVSAEHQRKKGYAAVDAAVVAKIGSVAVVVTVEE